MFRDSQVFDIFFTKPTGEYSCLRVDLTFRREFSYYLIQIYIPCIMLVIVSWVSFWLDPNAIPARVSLGVTTLLTMATQISGINASLPQVSYTKAIDVWTGVCLTFVFGALLEFALVNYASRSDAHRAAFHHFGQRRWDADGNITDDGMPPPGYNLVRHLFLLKIRKRVSTCKVLRGCSFTCCCQDLYTDLT